jgi:enoyl-[acyl-carrier protein] reductase III
MGEHDDDIAVVTGGSKGIGRAIALDLARAGAAVAISYLRDRASAEKTLAELEELGARAIAVKCYLKDPDQPRALMARARDELGEPTVLVSNAASGVFKAIRDLKSTHWDLAMDTNATALMRLVQASRSLRNIVAITSHGSHRTLPGYGSVGVSKAALEALVRYLAVELAPDVRVNAICPGLVATESVERLLPLIEMQKEMSIAMTPMQRLVTPEDVADLASFLLGSRAAMITGQVLVVDGGVSIALGPSLDHLRQERMRTAVTDA